MNRLEIGWGKTNTIIRSWLWSEFLSLIEFIKCIWTPWCSNEGVPFYPLHRKPYRPIKNQLLSFDHIWDVFLGVTRTCGGDNLIMIVDGEGREMAGFKKLDIWGKKEKA